MNRRYLSFIALAASMLFGVSFVVLDDKPKGYAAVGGVIVALLWTSVGVFGKDDDGNPVGRDRDRDREL